MEHILDVLKERGFIAQTTFEDELYGPDFRPLVDAIVRENLATTIICESAGTQSEDALMMKKYYLEKLG